VEFSTKTGSPEKRATPCIAVGVYAGRSLSAAARALDKASQGGISEVLGRGDMEGKLGSTLLLYRLPGVAAERVLLVGLGTEADLHEREFREAARSAVKAAQETGAGRATLCFTEIRAGRRDSAWKARHVALVAAECAYRFDTMKSKKTDPRPLAHIELLAAARDANAAARGLREGGAIGSGASLAKDLGNLPGNVCTPTFLAEQAQKLARQWKLEVEVLERKDMEKLAMGSLLSVAQGSRQPPKLIVLHYAGGAKKAKPVVLVGKGITFDTGGISLKPGPEMDEMKFDMCGAASVLGAIEACAQMKLRLNVIGIIPATENMPGGAATKPGDIVTSMSGQTIEVLNTDAEGRLILCDALSYAERFDPAAVVDIATLTGACVIALGHVASGLYSNRDALARELLAAGDEACDRAWHMPLWDDYQEQLKSNFADMANIGGRPAGSVTAACFLSRFTKKFDWAHLDIAGTAWKSGKDKGSTGRPVALLAAFLMKRAGKA
jgi:leucyl aminopeptidase